MEKYEIVLEKYKGKKNRYKCPGCGGRYELTRYINTTTKNYLADHVGRCNRENSCGYHFTPKEFYKENPNLIDRGAVADSTDTLEPVKIDFLPDGYLDNSRKDIFLEQNNFFKFLTSLFTELVAVDLFNIYCIGTAGYWKGSVLFPQIDIEGNFRHLKIMLHDPITGKRVKEGSRASLTT